MISLTSKIEPLFFEVDDYELPVNTDFRNVINALNNSNDVQQYIVILCEPLLDVMSMMLYDGTKNSDECDVILTDFVRFINDSLFNLSKSKNTDTTKPPILDFDVDAQAIMGSMQQAYNINLMQTNFLDYRIFITYLTNMVDTKMNSIWEIRTMDVPTGKGTEKQRAKILEMKRAYAIDKDDDEDAILAVAKQLSKGSGRE